MYQHLGILGGISHVSTAAYYERIVSRFHEQSTEGRYPEITIASLDFKRFTDYEDNGERAQYIDYIVAGMERLGNAGVRFALMAANSPHAVYDDVVERSPIPLVSIVQSTVIAAVEQGLERLLLLGIDFTMRQAFYGDAGFDRGIEIISPSVDHRHEIDRIIFKELCYGIIKTDSRDRLCEIIGSYRVDGAILGCTELPLLLSQCDSEIPLLDSMALHCETAVNVCLGHLHELSYLQEGGALDRGTRDHGPLADGSLKGGPLERDSLKGGALKRGDR